MTHFVVFHDKSKKSVGEKEAKILWEKIADGKLAGVKLNGEVYKLSSIAKILSLDEFYNQYPDERPASTPDNFKKYTSDQIRKPTKKAKELMLRGLSRYIKDHGGDRAKNLYEQMSGGEWDINKKTHTSVLPCTLCNNK